ncbi:YfiT family bacillithiol transferase [Spongiivirga citrea]|uniref:Putative metal-dependent hydrolase n=1 Tax=Spongiivirga citrea TaxID=1481457 RepID=A0A6M0CLN7_9FLAO|nr:putative metal-dependent hydrolase [Spongiivirga citrea]NER17893.1 putative metal-dependent hydrolase [Spongiivirga citrea]
MTNQLDKLRYPIGQFEAPERYTQEQIDTWVQVLEAFPEKLTALVADLSDKQLNTPYRPGGWTVRQTVHHLADSHHHSYTRFKWTLTEDKPRIKAYFEQDWAELEDARNLPIQISLDYLKAIHAKLVATIKSLSNDQLNRSYIHPEGDVEVNLKKQTGIYAWHSRHHYAHIANLIQREGW